jgi:hypothetical protein
MVVEIAMGIGAGMGFTVGVILTLIVNKHEKVKSINKEDENLLKEQKELNKGFINK